MLEWVGDADSESAGRLGLWQICHKDDIFDNCRRRWEAVFSVPTFSFQVRFTYTTSIYYYSVVAENHLLRFLFYSFF